MDNGKASMDGNKKTNCLGPCILCCQSCLQENVQLPEHPSIGQRFKYGLSCPPHGPLAFFLLRLLVIGLFYGVCWAVVKEDALPGGNIFSLVVLLVLCMVAGYLCEKIRLPSLLGMLLMGFALRNIPVVNVGKDIRRDWSAALRHIALVIILVKAGLGLDYEKLKNLSWAVLRLSLLPMISEATSVAVASHLLFKFPWSWAFMLGLVHAAVSPAVVVPTMLHLAESGYGVDKGIHILLIAGGSIENVLAISGFSLTLGLTFSQGSLAWNIARCPVEIITGISYGLIAGIICWMLPEMKEPRLGAFRSFLVLGGGLFANFGFRAFGVPGSGALGCLVLAFIAAHHWRKQGWPGGKDHVALLVSNLWLIFQPLMFGLIGAEVRVSDISPSTIGLGTAVLAIGLVFRSTAAFLSGFGTKLNKKEKLFVMLSWLPKATVQAAIGSNALDAARSNSAGEESERMGNIILTMAVYIILVTAPIGAILMSLTAPKLLHRTPTQSTKTVGQLAGEMDGKVKPIEEDTMEEAYEWSTYL